MIGSQYPLLGGRLAERLQASRGINNEISMGYSLRVKSAHPQAPETWRPPESDFRGRYVLYPSSHRSKTPGNLRFTALSGEDNCEVGKPTGAAVGTGFQPALGQAQRLRIYTVQPSTKNVLRKGYKAVAPECIMRRSSGKRLRDRYHLIIPRTS